VGVVFAAVVDCENDPRWWPATVPVKVKNRGAFPVRAFGLVEEPA
jgi:hypothetical protein